MANYGQSAREIRRNALINSLNNQRNILQQKQYEQAQQQAQAQAQQNADFFTKVGETGLDLFGNVIAGASKAIEGIVDFGSSLVGAVGGIFDSDFQKRIQENIAYDWTGENISKPLQNATTNSYLNDMGEVGNFVRNVSNGVGQMLPAVAMNILVPGSGLITMGAGAMGSGTEKAFKDGGDYYRGLAYGALSGGVEMATEKMFGGATKAVTGKGYLDNLTKNIGKSGLAKVGKVMAEEGVEEMASELVDPLVQNVYKDKGFFEDFLTKEHLSNIANAGAVGAVTGGVFGGTVGQINKNRNNALENLHDLKSLEKKEENMFTSGELFDGNNQKRIDDLRTAIQSELSQNISKMNDKNRANFIKQHNLSNLVDESGALLQNNGKVNKIVEQTRNNANITQNTLDRRYYSPSLKGQENKITEKLQSQGVKVFSGELSQKEQENYNKFKKAFTALGQKGVVDAKFVVSETSKKFDSYIDGNVIVMGKELFEDDTWQKKLVHEINHFAEGSKEWAEFAKFVLSETDTKNAKLTVLRKNYGITENDLVTLADNLASGKLTDGQKTYISELIAHQSETLFGDEKTIERLAKEHRNLAQRILDKIRDFIKVLKAKTPEEKEFIRKLQTAEKLFDNALKNAGLGYAMKESQKVDKNSKNDVEYSKKSYYNQFDTTAMTWAHENERKNGDTKVLYDANNNTWNLLVANNNIDIGYYVSESIKDIPRNEKRIKDLVFGEAYDQDNRTNAHISKDIEEYESQSRRYSSNNGRNNQETRVDGRTGGIYQEQPNSDARTNQSESNGNKQGIKYSLKDTHDNPLSQNQIDFFANSQIRDDNGRLLVVYHGTDASFNEFKNKPAQYGRAITDGFYFTLRKENAQKYGKNVKEVYLNIENPFFLHNGNGVIAELSDRDYTISRLIKEFNAETDDTGLPTPKALKKVLQKLGYDGVVSDTIDGITDKIDTSYSETQIVAFNSNQIKNIDNKNPTISKDIRYSLKENNLGEKLTEQQAEFFKDSKIRVKEVNGWKETISPDGKLFKVYHGTDSDEFFKFDKNMIGLANDMGWYGKGYYFAFSKFEASTYGDRVLECYLNIKNPFFFTEEMQSYDGVEDGDILFDFASFVVNLADKFPALAKNLSTDYATKYNNMGESDISTISFYDLAKKIKEIYESKRLQVIPFQNGDEVQYGYIMRSNLENLDIPKELKELVKKERLYSAWSADYALEKGKISEEQHDVLYEKIYERYDKEDLEDEFVGYYRFNSIEEAKENRLSMATDYLHRYVYRDFDIHMPETYMQQIGDDFRNALIKSGYDGVLQSATGDEVVAFYENQIKLASNKAPTENDDIRYSLKDDDFFDTFLEKELYQQENNNDNIVKNDNNVAEKSNIVLKKAEKSTGQMYKQIANNSKDKVYSKADAIEIIDEIVADKLNFNNKYRGELKGKTRDEIIDHLFISLNKESGYDRLTVAQDIADYLIFNARYTDTVGSSLEDDSYSMEAYSAIKDYRRKLDLSTLKGEIAHKFDTRRVGIVFANWGAPKGTRGIGVEDAVAELNQRGIMIKADNDADALFNMLSVYDEARTALKSNAQAQINIAQELNASEIEKVKQEIVSDILKSYQTKGEKSKWSEQVSKYNKRIEIVKNKLYEARAISRLVATVNTIDKMKRTKPADMEYADEVRALMNAMSKITTYKGNLSKQIKNIMRSYCQVRDGVKLYNLLAQEYDQNGNHTTANPFNELIESIANSKDDKLSLSEINNLTLILENFIHNVRTYDRMFWQDKEIKTQDLATRAIEETKQTIPFKDSLIPNFSRWLESPYTIFEKLSNYDKNGVMAQAYKEFINGVIKQETFKRDTVQLFQEFNDKHKKLMKSWREQTFDMNGVKISRGQAMSIYMLSQRKQAIGHLLPNDNGTKGIIHLSNEKYAKKNDMYNAIDKGIDIEITSQTLKDIEQSLTAEEKEYIALAKKFFNDLSKNAKKETDIALYGVSNVLEDNYFPIRVADDQIYKEVGKDFGFAELFTVYNASFNKETKPNSKNKIVVENISDVINRHASQMASYYGLAVPFKMFNRVYNKNIKNKNGESIGKLRIELNNVWSGFHKYINKLLLDSQGKGYEKTFFDRLLSKVRGWGVKSALGLNLKSWASQLISLPAGKANGIEYKYLVYGLSKSIAEIKGDESLKTIEKYCPLLWSRFRNGNNVDVGFAKENLGVVGHLDAITDWTMAPIGFMDKRVCIAVWHACYKKLANTGKYEVGSEEHLKATADLTQDTVIRTQANYTALLRPEALRHKNAFVQFATMFMSEPMQQFTLLATAVDKWRVAKKTGNAELLAQAKQEAKCALVAVLVDTLILTAISQLFRFIKGNDDDEDKAKTIAIDFMQNYVGMFPFFKEILTYVEGYDITNMAYTGMTNIMKAIEELCDATKYIISSDKQDGQELWGSLRKAILGISQTFGIPVRNLETYLKGMTKLFSPSLVYKYNSFFYNKSLSIYTSDLNKAIANGDDKLADTILDIMLEEERLPVKDSKIRAKMKSLYEQGYDVFPKSVGSTIIYDNESHNLSKSQYDKFINIYSSANDEISSLLNDKSFAKLGDELQAKSISFIYNYYYKEAIRDMLGVDMEDKLYLFATAIDVGTLAQVDSYVKSLESDKDKNGNTISGSKKNKVISYINSLKISATQKYILMGYFGYKNNNGERQVKSYIQSLKLTKKEKEILFKKCGY